MAAYCRITLPEGILEGESCCTNNGKQYNRYLGIPYAKPPVGELRFKNPVPLEKWNGVLDATEEGKAASQIDDITKKFIGDEDCLYLNIVTPTFPEDSPELLPVFVYIHGGGFINGSGSLKTCGPEYIIEKDCLFVSLNYRLNVLGFLCLETDDCSGNMGLLDQHMALKWVHKNISAFGGDPENVTLIGISAGAASIESHIMSPMTPPNLFHKAIIQSGTIANVWSIERRPLDLAIRLAKKMGIDTEDTNKLFELFKKAPAEELVTAATKILKVDDVKNYASYGCFKPVIWSGNSFLNKLPTEILKSGQFLKIPTIVGHCSDEYLILEDLFNKLKEYTEKQYVDLIPLQLNINKTKYKKRLIDLYGIMDHDSTSPRKSGDFITDLAFLSGILFAADMKLSHGKPLYFYCFSYDGKMNYSKQLRGITSKGTCHADDQTYIGTNCDVTEDLADPCDVSVRKRIIQMWTDFAKYGDPTPRLNDEITTRWLPMKKDEFIYMEINKNLVLNRNLDEYMKKRRDIWMEMYRHYDLV